MNRSVSLNAIRENPIRANTSNRPTGRLPALLLVAIVTAACSATLHEVRDEPPQAAIDRLERRNDHIVVDLALRNVNDEPLRFESATLTLSLDGKALATGGREHPLSIAARGREVLHLPMPAQAAGLDRLDALASGELQRLPWSMETRLSLDGQRDLTWQTEGWLHRVPGQPNRFR